MVLSPAFAIPAWAQAHAYTTLGGGELYRIDLGTGLVVSVGPTGRDALIDIAFDPEGRLFGIDFDTGDLVRIDPETGQASLQAATGLAEAFALTFDACGRLWVSAGESLPNLYLVELDTGGATPFGPVPAILTSAIGEVLYGAATDLVAYDPLEGKIISSTQLSPLPGLVQALEMVGSSQGIAAAGCPPFIPLPGLHDRLFTIDAATGSAQELVSLSLGGSVPVYCPQNLAVAPPPGSCGRGSAAAIPVLSPWALVLLAVWIGILGARSLRPRTGT